MKLITINRTFESCIISWNKAQIKKMDLYKNRRNADFQFCFRQKNGHYYNMKIYDSNIIMHIFCWIYLLNQ